MIAIADALKQWRLNSSELKTAGPDRKPVAVALSTDSNIPSLPFPRIVSSVSFQASETLAVIPFTLVDEIEVSEHQSAQILSLVDKVYRIFHNKSYFTTNAVIHKLILRSVESDTDIGTVKKIRMTWEGQGSVTNG